MTHPVKRENVPDAGKLPYLGYIVWCVDRIKIEPARLVVYVRRELTKGSVVELEYGSDEGNRNMYLLDDRGRRYDSTATSGSAKEGGKLEERGRLVGSFVFPAPELGAQSFVFHDDDDHVKLEGLRPDPGSRLDGQRQKALRDLTAAADRIRFTDSWSGLASPSAASCVLLKTNERWAGEATFSVRNATRRFQLALQTRALAAFLEELGDSPLLDIQYRPTIEHTDDFPHLRIELNAGSELLVFRSESQGTGHVPWAAELGGRTFTVPSDAPARALERLMAALGVSNQKVMRELRREVEENRGSPGRRR